MTIPESTPAITRPAYPSTIIEPRNGVVALAWVAIAFGVIALPGVLIFIPRISETVLYELFLVASYIATLSALLSWLLAVIASLLAGVQLLRRRNTRSSRKALALAGPGAILGTAALVTVIVSLGNLLGIFQTNGAERAGEPAVGHYLDQGSALICDNGNNGYGENSTPWYEAYIDAPAKLQSEEQAREALALAGYPDAQIVDISEAYELDPSTEAFEVQSLGPDGATASSQASVDVFSREPVSLSCSTADVKYGEDRTAASGRVIVVVHVQLVPTR